jgi:manganese/zinc/iron transport system permease protein
MNLFTDPLLRAPTWGCVLIGMTAGIVGAFLYLQRRPLAAETLAHAAYPGAAAGLGIVALLGWSPSSLFMPPLVGALCCVGLCLKALNVLGRRSQISSDGALAFLLASFFGVGVLISSALQRPFPLVVKQVQALLFGQAATLQDRHLPLFAALALCTVVATALLFRPLQATLYHRELALSMGVRVRAAERALFWLTAFIIAASIRTVGAMLLSGLLIAPPIAARQWSHRLSVVLGLSAGFGALSGLIGQWIATFSPVPTGPSVVLTAVAIALVSLCVSPKRGLLFRAVRIARFRNKTVEDNVLKWLWKKGEQPVGALQGVFPGSSYRFGRRLRQMEADGWISGARQGRVSLTADGRARAASVVRLHRLWELYLAEKWGAATEEVHRSAEEMEHILTPELEEALTRLLDNPELDPHRQPIPERHGL